MSTDESASAPYPRGLYQLERGGDGSEGLGLRSELPFKHAEIIRRDGSNRRTDTDYLLSRTKDGPRVLISSARVRNGEWAGAVGIKPSADRKVIDAAGTAIFHMEPLGGRYGGELEAVPRIGPDGKVTVPVAEALPAGYFETGSLSRPEALARWRNQIVPVAVANPKLALAMGGAASSPYLGALFRQSHLVNLDGDSDRGKSTAMKVTAGIFGNPFIKGGLLGSWAGTRVRLPRRLGLLGILPCFLDERGMADFTTPTEWGKAIYAITDGPREVAESRGSGLKLTAPWDGVLVSAGNGSLLDGLGAGPYAGVGIKRVVSLQTPFTRNADEAEAMIDALRDAYGHPGMAIVETFTVSEVGKLIRAAVPLVGMPTGGNPRSLAKNLHGHVAGAAMLDQILGTGTALRDAAAVAARDYLEANGRDPEHDADRMMSIIRETIASAPARWPTVSEYREHKLPRFDGDHPAPDRIDLPQHGVDRQIAGVLADDGSWFAVFPAFLDDLLSRAGADRALALAEADKRGWLHRTASDRRAGKFGTKIMHIPGRPYRFDLPPDDDGQDVSPEPERAEPEPSPEPAGPEPEIPAACAGCGSPRPLHSPGCPDVAPPEPPADYDPAIWDEPIWEPGAAAEPGPAEIPAALRQLGADAIAEPANGPAEHPFARAVRAYLADCERAGIATKYHPTADGAVKMIAHHGAAEAQMIRDWFAAIAGESHGRAGAQGLTSATKDPDLFASMKPAPREAERESPAVAKPTVPAQRVTADSVPAGRGEIHGQDEAEREAFAREVLAQHPEATADDITAALGIFHETWGLRFFRSPSWTGITTLRRDVAAFGAKTSPIARTLPVLAEIHEAGPLRHIAFVSPGQSVKEGMHFTAWDVNGQHPAAAGSAYLGTANPEVAARPRKVAPFLGKPGYMQTAARLVTKHPAYGTIDRGEWITMPHAKFLAVDLGLDLTAAQVVYWDRGNASKHLGTFAARYRKAREALQGRADLPAVYARIVVKAVANKTIGMLRSEDHNRTEFYVPDWYDQIVATADANALRHFRKVHEAGGGLPIGKCADAAWWVSRAEREHPAGLEVSGQLGKWKLEKWGIVTPEITAAYRDRNPGALQSAIKSADTARRDGERA